MTRKIIQVVTLPTIFTQHVDEYDAISSRHHDDLFLVIYDDGIVELCFFDYERRIFTSFPEMDGKNYIAMFPVKRPRR